MTPSTLTKRQVRIYGPKEYTEGGKRYRIKAEVRYDDQCGNGHNSFSITGDIDRADSGFWREDSGGCCHDEIAKEFPELAPLIKWHLCDSTGPMHYPGNVLYWLGWQGWCDGDRNSPPNIRHARNTAVWPELPESFVCPDPVKGGGVRRDQPSLFEPQRLEIVAALEARLPALLEEFKAAVESLGFVW